MKTLFIHNTLAEYRIEFFEHLSKNVTFELLITDKDLETKIYGFSQDTIILNKKINVHFLGKSMGKFKNLRIFIQNGAYDNIILPPADTVFQFVIGCIALKFAQKKKSKVIYWCEKWEAELNKQPLKKRIKNYIHKCMITYLCKRADAVIASGSKSKHYLKNAGILDGKIKIAYDSSSSPKTNSIDIRTIYSIPKNGKIILYLGRIVERKGCDKLIKAFSEFKKCCQNSYLIICGDGDKSYINLCNQIINDMHMNGVIFAGKVQPENRFCYYRQSDVFVLPSYTHKGIIECWGLSVNEALEAGTPVITTTAVGSGYDLLNGKNGLVIEENNTSELVKALKEILLSGKADVYRLESLKTYEHFSVSNMANSFAAAIINLK